MRPVEATPPWSRADPCPTSGTWRSPPGQPSASTRSSRPPDCSSWPASSCSPGGPRRPGNGLVRARHPRRDRVVTPGGPRLLRPPPTTVVQRMHHQPLNRRRTTMQFSNKKKAVAGALIAVGGLALVGVGTGAAFTDTVTANSTFKAGTVDLDITDAPNFAVSTDGNTATLKPARANFNTTGVQDVLRHHQGDEQRRHQGAAERGRQRRPVARHQAMGMQRVRRDNHSNPVQRGSLRATRPSSASGRRAPRDHRRRLRQDRRTIQRQPSRAPARDPRNQLIPDPPASPSSPSRFGGAGCARACPDRSTRPAEVVAPRRR